MKNWLMAVAFSLAACSNTAVLTTWKKPGVGAIHFTKVAVIAPASDTSTRRAIEDQVVAKLASVPAVPSYSVLDELPNREVVKKALMEQGFDGAVVIRIASVDKQATWVPGPVTTGFGAGPWPTYGAGYGYGYGAGYTAVDTYVRVETEIYSLEQDGLVFSAASRTANPANIRSLVDETVEALSEEVKKQGLTSTSVSVTPSF